MYFTYFLWGLLGLSFICAIIYNAKKNSSPTAPLKAVVSAVFFVIAIITLVLGGQSKALIFSAMLMAISFAGMIYCARKQKMYANAQSAAIFLFMVVLGCMVTILSITMGGGESKWLIENEMKYSKAAATMMAKKIAQTYPDHNALIIVEKNYEKNKRTMDQLAGIKEAFEDKVKIGAIDYVKIPPPPNFDKMSDEEKMMYESMPTFEMMKAENFDSLINDHKDCNLILSLVGLPYDVGQLSIWTMDPKKRPKVALLFADVYMLKRAIKAGYLIALTYKPGVKFTEDPCPKDPQEAFNQRYIILMSDNVDKVDQKMFAEGSPQNGKKGNR